MCPETSSFETRSQNTARCHQNYGSYRCLKSARAQEANVNEKVVYFELFTDTSCSGLPWRIVCRCTCHSQHRFCASCWRVWDLGRERCDGSISSSWRSAGTRPDGSAGPVPSDSPAHTRTKHHIINLTQLSSWAVVSWVSPLNWAYIYLADTFIPINSNYFSVSFENNQNVIKFVSRDLHSPSKPFISTLLVKRLE